jgi:hypothetical protein
MNRPLSDQEAEHFAPRQSRERTPEQRIYDELCEIREAVQRIEQELTQSKRPSRSNRRQRHARNERRAAHKVSERRL